MFFATTALTKYWDEHQHLLLAGNWCEIGNKEFLSKHQNEVIVLEYPWNNRDNLLRAYHYTNSKYENYFPFLVEWLNKYHGLKYSTKYWEKITGIWLRYYIQVVYDRYSIVKQATQNFPKLSTIISEKNHIFVPNDFNHYFQLYTQNHLYNFILFSQIIYFFSDRIDINQTDILNETKTGEGVGRSEVSVSFLKKIYDLMGKMPNNSPYFFYKSGLSLMQEIQLALSFKSFPFFDLGTGININKKYINHKVRQEKILIPSQDQFDEIISEYLLRHLPFVYLEGYETLHDKVLKMQKKPPKAFITSNSMVGDEVFKGLVAYNCERGSKLLIHQHGGHYGAGKFYPLEDYETKIADHFLSWGWKSDVHNNIIPFWGSILSHKKKPNYNNSRKILIATVSSPLYAKYYYSAPLSFQVLDELKMHLDLIDNLPSKIRKQIVYRLKKDYGWGECSLLTKQFPTVKFESPNQVKFLDSLLSSRLFIATYNATVFLQSFSLNIPTMILWKKELRELRETAIPYYVLLEHAGILHTNPVKMAKKIISINDHVWEWWTQELVQNAKDSFCDYYARVSKNIVADYKTIIEQTVD